MSHNFSDFIKLVGAGKRAGRSLSEEEAYIAMSMLLSGQASELQKGAFLMLLRVREETVEELSGFVRACKEQLNFTTKVNSHSTAPNALPRPHIDIGAYAGKRRQLPWFLLALGVIHQQGFTMLMHGASEPQSQRLYIKDALRELGVLNHVQSFSLKAASDKVQRLGISYIDLADAHPQLNDIIQLRSELGLRSCANTLARLLNPLNAKYSVQGVHHCGVDEKHIQVASQMNIAHENKDTNVLCFRGEGGEPEINPSKDTELHFFKQLDKYIVQLGARQSWQIKPKQLNIQSLRAVWSGEAHSQYAEHTIASTLSALIMLLTDCGQEQAYKSASTWWQARNPEQWFGVKCEHSRNQKLTHTGVSTVENHQKAACKKNVNGTLLVRSAQA
ncbi:glycosyl transferase family protein [Ningiella sp. W23]|uniref:glycosyl transferase family protein n=1 Tax=Ningiella sp. W23 TaxID=3023715 RepID=UPI0037569817